MMQFSSQLESISGACLKLKERDKREVDYFQELVEGYEFHLNKSIELQEHCDKKDKEIVLLREHKDALAETLHQTTQSNFKFETVNALEDKLSKLQSELVECYRSNSELAQQVLQATNGLQATREDIQFKQTEIEELNNELENRRVQIESLEETTSQLRMAVEVAAEEASLKKAENQNLQFKIKQLEKENQTLIDRWVKLKLEEANHLNEANAMYEDMMSKSKTFDLVKLAKKQINGIVKTSDVTIPNIETKFPTTTSHMFKAHDGGCSTLAISKIDGRTSLFTGGNDQLVKLWNLDTATLKDSLRGSLGPILDLSVNETDSIVLGSSGDGKVYVWDLRNLRVRHVLSGHTEKVVSVSLCNHKRNVAVSAGYDRTIKVWDLDRGYVQNTMLCSSQCNSVVMGEEGDVILSGHNDGRIRVWDRRTNRLNNEMTAHSNGITCVRLSVEGTCLLTCGKDNEIHLIDIRTFEILRSFQHDGFRVSTNWHKICFGNRGRLVVSGSVDGSVFIWNKATGSVELVLKENKSPVLVCEWPMNGPLVTADKLGFVRLWH